MVEERTRLTSRGEGGSRRARPQKRNDDENLRSKAAGPECDADEMNLPPLGAKNCGAQPELQKKRPASLQAASVLVLMGGIEPSTY